MNESGVTKVVATIPTEWSVWMLAFDMPEVVGFVVLALWFGFIGGYLFGKRKREWVIG